MSTAASYNSIVTGQDILCPQYDSFGVERRSITGSNSGLLLVAYLTRQGLFSLHMPFLVKEGSQSRDKTAVSYYCCSAVASLQNRGDIPYTYEVRRTRHDEDQRCGLTAI